MSSNTTLPLFMTAASEADVVGFNIQNSGELVAQAGYTTFGQVFAVGAIKPTQSLTATIDGVRYPVQVDAKTYYPDGSLQMAVLTVGHGIISANATTQGMLSVTAQGMAGEGVDLVSVLKGASASADLLYSDGSESNVDLFAAARSAVANGSANIWLNGPDVTQISFSTPVQRALRLVTTISAFADGTYTTNVSFNNDMALGPSGGALTYSVNITQNGKVVSSTPTLTEYQYQDWQANFSTSSAFTLNVQHDPSYLEAAKAIPQFNLVTGVASSVISSEQQALAQPGFDSPLSNNYVTPYMPTTGGRGDIGPTTQANAAWLVSQDPTAASFALAQADASGAVPWNMWDSSRNEFLNTDAASDIWTDGRGGPGSYTTGLTQAVDSQDSGWVPDTSHQPDLSYYAFLMTGSDSYLQSLNAQASWDITDTWAPQRGTQQLVVNQQQVRAAAWNLRDLDEASYANPDGSAPKAYFTGIADANWSWLVAQIPAWTSLQGAAYGQVEGTYSPGKMGPWQQDYFASTAIQAAEHGNADALTFLKWESNFLVGRFLQPDFSPRDGIAYNLTIASSDGTRLQSWAAIEAATVASGNSNGTTWSQSEGDYGEVALNTLSGIISLTGSSDAIRAYNYLITSQAPATDMASRAQDVQYDTIPTLPVGLTFAPDGTIVPVEQILAPMAGNAPANRTAPPVALAASSPSSPLVLKISEDAYQGDAQFTVFVDGQQIGGIYTATASHSAGQTQSVSLPGSLTAGTHAVAVDFINDSYGGPSLDRNLYVDGASFNGSTISGSSAPLFSNGADNFSVTVPSPTLVLSISEDAWNGDAQYTISVDGTQVGGVLSATASHNAGQTQSVAIPASFASGTHDIAINFVNDAYGGPGEDRNLYLDGASIDGQAVTGASASLFQNGSFDFRVDTQKSDATSIVTASEMTDNSASPPIYSSLVLDISEDAYQGDAQFTVFVDGQQIGGIYTATASHSAGQTQSVSLPGSLTAGTHAVAVDFINDSYGGPGLDRNLYVDGALINGSTISGSSAPLFSNGADNFSVTVPSPTLVLSISEDAWNGDAQYTISVDGTQVGGVLSATASHNAGQTQSVAIPASFASGTHDIAINFVNDAYGGPGEDRNLYLDGASIDGQAVTGASASLFQNGSFDFRVDTQKSDATSIVTASEMTDNSASPPIYSSLVLDISEDAYQGDAQFTVFVDGQQIGGIYTATASHSAGQTQSVSLPGSLTAGTHAVAVDFINDSYGGPGLDRNLYVDGASINGSTISGSSAPLFSNGADNFSVTVPSPTLVLSISEDAWNGDAQYTISVDGTQVGGVLSATASHNAGQTQSVAIPASFASGTHDIAINFVNDAYGGPGEDRNLYLDGASIGGQAVTGASARLFANSSYHFDVIVASN